MVGSGATMARPLHPVDNPQQRDDMAGAGFIDGSRAGGPASRRGSLQDTSMNRTSICRAPDGAIRKRHSRAKLSKRSRSRVSATPRARGVR